MAENHRRDNPQVYAIQVAGHLDSRRSEWFDGLSVIDLEDGQTMLTGCMVDQAALYGVLAKARDMGLTLISVRRIVKSE